MRRTKARLCRSRVLGVAIGGLIAIAAIWLVEVWNNPPGRLHSAHRFAVHILHWGKDHWLSATAIGTMAAIVAATAPFMIRRLDRRSASQDREDVRSRRRSIMLKMVRYDWINGILEPSLENAALLVLGLARRPDMLDLSQAFRRFSNGSLEPLEGSADIREIFDRTGGGILIIGEPGAGKTTLLLQLTDHLLNQADSDSSLPIPVVFNLATWSQHRTDISEWLVSQLIQRYQVAAAIAQTWIAEDAIVPLLDGLDEVAAAHRPALVEAINSFHHDRRLVPLVVCCRTRELQDIATRLSLEDAIELQPPSDEQIDAYLRYLEETGTPLWDVRANFKSDSTLYELLRSPLMLHVVTLAYHGLSASSLTGKMSRVDRQSKLWDAYIDRMFTQRPIPSDCGYSESQAREWVYWLAHMLKDHDQTEFQLDRLAPQWLPDSWPGKARLMAGLATGVITATIGCLAFGLTFGWIAGTVTGLIIGLVLGVDAGLSGTPRWRSFPTVEQVKWSWRRMLVGLFPGLLAGVAGGVLVAHFHGFYGGLGFALAGALGGGLVGGVTSTLRDERTVPNEGIRRSARHAARFGISAGVAAALIGGLTNVQGIGLITGIGIGAAGAMTGGIAIGLVVNTHTGIASVLSHYAVRMSLVRLQRAPWSYPAFLEGMTQRLLLRHSGSAYLFAHRLLRDHIADSGIQTSDIPEYWS